ncbi:hypothetical protein B0H13DRAFT_1884206 [Mycena leptocephala]|nr:hypothetical protein B0H13DRAFT_1884206 [Mycena leptocephala]
MDLRTGNNRADRPDLSSSEHTRPEGILTGFEQPKHVKSEGKGEEINGEETYCKKYNYLVIVNIQFIATALIVREIRRIYEVMVKSHPPENPGGQSNALENEVEHVYFVNTEPMSKGRSQIFLRLCTPARGTLSEACRRARKYQASQRTVTGKPDWRESTGVTNSRTRTAKAHLRQGNYARNSGIKQREAQQKWSPGSGTTPGQTSGVFSE